MTSGFSLDASELYIDVHRGGRGLPPADRYLDRANLSSGHCLLEHSGNSDTANWRPHHSPDI